MTTLKFETAQKFQDHLRSIGFDNQVVELPDSARTAQEAADAINCEVAQIAKSIIFRYKGREQSLLVVTSGINRVNEKELMKQLGERFGKADADFVREHTGYAIGGVAPIGHLKAPVTIIDEDLLQYATLWAAAGHPKAVFELTPNELVEMTAGKVMRVK